jgi:branched-chain amino acid transport system substrate-binding protein
MMRAILLTICLAAGISIPALSRDTIKVGELGSLTGDNASFGTSQNNGVQMAVKEINDSGGVLGKKIQLLVEDNETTEGETTNCPEADLAGSRRCADR